MSGKKRQSYHYSRSRAQAQARIRAPTRQEHLLRQAIDRCGLAVVGYEYEVEDDATGGYHWFDVALDLNGQLAWIDLVNDPAKGGVTHRERAIYQEKRALADRWNVPLLQMAGAPSSELEARIRYWVQWEVKHARSE